MRFSLNFIKEFVEVSQRPEKLASLLTMAGMEVEALEKCGDDWIFDIEVTTNRYDWLSTLGVAREVAAVTGKKVKVKAPKVSAGKSLDSRKILIEDKDDCPYYIGRLIRDVKVLSSPKWLAQRVINCGSNSVNDIVDITNYCMLKWGNPLHAFDNDKLEGDIYIRRAKKGEKFIGIDDKQRILSKENLVIADSKKIVALAGVMGAKNTEVDSSTKNIFLEAAIFSPLTIRRSRRAAGLDTESSYRFERRVSSKMLEYASAESAELIGKIAKGKIVGLKRAGKSPLNKNKAIIIEFKKLNDYLGQNFEKARVKSILKSLDFQVKDLGANKISVIANSERFDIKEAVDIYEEFIRVYGYDKIEDRVPALSYCPANSLLAGKTDIYSLKNELSQRLVSLGFKEIITFSLEDQEDLEKMEQKDFIRILNPLRSQENSMRTTLLGGMIRSIRHNLNHNQSSLSFYELADIYSLKAGGFCEIPNLSLGASGEDDNFFHLKRVVEEILGFLDINVYQFKESESKIFPSHLRIIIEGKDIGFIGKLSTQVKEAFDLREDLYFAEIDLLLLASLRQEKKYTPFSLYPVIFRDISIVLNRKVKFEKIEKVIREKGKHLENLNIVDTYKGKDLPINSIAFTLRLSYQSQEKTLTSSEVDQFHNNIREEIIKIEGVNLR